LKTTVFPQTSAGAIFQLGIAIGKFPRRDHGRRAESASRTLIWNLSGSSEAVV